MSQESKSTSTSFSVNNFETLDDPERERLVREVKKFVLAIENNETPRILTICGTSGIGKTMLSRQVFWWAKMNPEHFGYAPLISWTESANLCSRFLNGEWGLPEVLIKQNFLVIDDIGTEADPNGTFRNRLQQVIDYRIDKWTILTTNFTLGQLQRYDSRLASRLFRGSCQVCLSTATDYNIELRLQKNGRTK